MKAGLVIFDWAGTLVDHGCRAPMEAFLEAFEQFGFPIDEPTARKPMGAHKRDHIIEIFREPEIIARVRSELKREPDDRLVTEIYALFEQRLPSHLAANAAPIAGVAETISWLRSHDIAIGSTTGYMRRMMNVIEPVAGAAGIEPDAIICADEVPQARPAPWACFRLAERFGVYPMSRCVKVGDTPADMAEGLNAGMHVVAVSETGNELGLSREQLDALDGADRAARVAAAEGRLRAAGAEAVLHSVTELPAWWQKHLR